MPPNVASTIIAANPQYSGPSQPQAVQTIFAAQQQPVGNSQPMQVQTQYVLQNGGQQFVAAQQTAAVQQAVATPTSQPTAAPVTMVAATATAPPPAIPTFQPMQVRCTAVVFAWCLHVLRGLDAFMDEEVPFAVLPPSSTQAAVQCTYCALLKFCSA
jgi:hypothetical protein